MEVQTNGATEAPSAPVVIDDSPLTLEQAASQLYEERRKEAEPDKPRAPDGKFAKAEPDKASAPAEQEAAAVEETQPSGEDAGADTAEVPPIEPPKSWTAEQREKFAALPRDAQEIIAERESARDADLSRRQNETAEQRKALEAKQQAVEQERTKAEQSAEMTLRVLHAQFMQEFSDVTDPAKLAAEDPFRAIQYQTKLQSIKDLASHVQTQQQERKSAEAKAFTDWAKEQDDKFAENYKEFADPVKGEKNREQAFNYFEKLGFTRDELAQKYNTPEFRDWRVQKAFWDAARFNAAQEKAKAAVAAPKPPVQRPGTTSRASSTESNIAALEAQLSKAHSVDDQIRLSAQILRLERGGKA